MFASDELCLENDDVFVVDQQTIHDYFAIIAGNLL